MSEPINLYKIKWIENAAQGAIERVAFMLADNVEQIVKRYPRLTSLESTGVATDLRK